MFGKKRDRDKADMSPLENKKDGKKKYDDQKSSAFSTPTKPSTSMEADGGEGGAINTPSVSTLGLSDLEGLAAKNSQTYAEAVKKPAKPPLDVNNLVYIQQGQQRREPIGQPLFLAFMEFLDNQVWSLNPEKFNLIKIDWSDHHLGRGLVACLDAGTAAFVKEKAESFNHEGKTVRGWSRDEFGTQIVFQGFLHSPVWKKKRPSATIAKILKMNGLLNSGKFQVITYQKHPKGVFVRFEVCEGLESAILKHGLSLNCGICRLVLQKRVQKYEITESGEEKLLGDDEEEK